jgi:hypothetical protein
MTKFAVTWLGDGEPVIGGNDVLPYGSGSQIVLHDREAAIQIAFDLYALAQAREISVWDLDRAGAHLDERVLRIEESF